MEFGKLSFPRIDIKPSSTIQSYYQNLYPPFSDLIEKTESGNSIVNTLNKDLRVIDLKEKLISQGCHVHRFEVETLAMWFVWCIHQSSFKEANEYLEDFLNSNEISVLNTLWVLGVEVEENIQLFDDCFIQPINQLPESSDQQIFYENSRQSLLKIPTPQCALTKPCQIKKVWIDPKSANQNYIEYWKTSNRLRETALLLNALDSIVCIPFYSTSYVDFKTPFGPFGGSGGSFSDYDVNKDIYSHLNNESKPLLEKIILKYNNQTDSEKNRLQRILLRLSQAKRRNQIEDKILDLGIALEMLLLDDNDNNEQLSLLFRLRGSWLLGNSAEDRITKYNELKKIYRCRSEVAHGGILGKGNVQKIDEVRKSFIDYQLLAEQICQKIIIEGKPKWDELILGNINKK